MALFQGGRASKGLGLGLKPACLSAWEHFSEIIGWGKGRPSETFQLTVSQLGSLLLLRRGGSTVSHHSLTLQTTIRIKPPRALAVGAGVMDMLQQYLHCGKDPCLYMCGDTW